MSYQFRKAHLDDIPLIWEILEHAIARRRQDGSNQWQDGYPNLGVVQNDVSRQIGYVMTYANEIVGYCAVMINDEPAYQAIQGQWLSNGDFVVIHRVAISTNYLGKGQARRLLHYVEGFARAQQIYSIKADTNFDNAAMLHLFNQLGYQYCGEVYFRGSARKAYEKKLSSPS